MREMPTALDDADTRLAAYGTLQPGRPNHRQLAGLEGSWRPGTVRGTLTEKGSGPDLGCPALILDDAGPAVAVSLFESPDLPRHWPRLDAFEGDGYARVLARVETAQGAVSAWIYVDAPQPPPTTAP
jgi:gamma-glutamylcyclotransferase (GGCT)/AIG2-like uncharacterized protein YtfP